MKFSLKSGMERDIMECRKIHDDIQELKKEYASYPLNIRAQALYGPLLPCPVCGKVPDVNLRFSEYVIGCSECEIRCKVSTVLDNALKVAVIRWNNFVDNE